MLARQLFNVLVAYSGTVGLGRAMVTRVELDVLLYPAFGVDSQRAIPTTRTSSGAGQVYIGVTQIGLTR